MEYHVNNHHSNDDGMLEHHVGVIGLILSFLGGAIGGLSATPKITLEVFHDPMLFDFIIRSLVGGSIGLGVKIFGDLIVHRIKARREKNAKNGDSQ